MNLRCVGSSSLRLISQVYIGDRVIGDELVIQERGIGTKKKPTSTSIHCVEAISVGVSAVDGCMLINRCRTNRNA